MDHLCPVSLENVASAMVGQTWPARSEALSRLMFADRNSLHNESKLVILGGSMTWGMGAFGCACNDSHVDTRCNFKPYITDRMCAWPALLTNWLKKQFKMLLRLALLKP